MGALVAGIWFAYLSNAGKFYVAAFFNLVRPPLLLSCALPPGPLPAGMSCQLMETVTAQDMLALAAVCSALSPEHLRAL